LDEARRPLQALEGLRISGAETAIGEFNVAFDGNRQALTLSAVNWLLTRHGALEVSSLPKPTTHRLSQVLARLLEEDSSG
jgi:hypothetical protein